MKSLSSGSLCDVMHNHFAVVALVVARTRDLLQGSHAYIAPFKNNEKIVALREVTEQIISFDPSVNHMYQPFIGGSPNMAIVKKSKILNRKP